MPLNKETETEPIILKLYSRVCKNKIEYGDFSRSNIYIYIERERQRVSVIFWGGPSCESRKINITRQGKALFENK